jgi:hypothetical protein
MDPKLPGDRSQREPLLSQVEGASEVNVMLARAAKPPTLGLRATYTRDDAVADQVALELGDRRQDVKEQPPGWGSTVNRLIQYN